MHKTDFFYYYFFKLESNLKKPSVFLCVCHLNKLLSLLCHSFCPTFHVSVFPCQGSVFTASVFTVQRNRYTHAQACFHIVFKAFPLGMDSVRLLLLFCTLSHTLTDKCTHREIHTQNPSAKENTR